MRKARWMVVAVALLSSCARTEEPRATLDAVAEAMGANGLSSIQYGGSGSTYGFQQSGTPGETRVKIFFFSPDALARFH